MPQMGPLPWVFLLFAVFCLVMSVLVMFYFINMAYLVSKSRSMNKNHLWVW